MRRIILDQLEQWHKSLNRKPLILQGARQVGKTYILKEFGKKFFNEVHYFNFEKEKGLHSFFVKELNPQEIIQELSFYKNKSIDIKNDLIIFDEIQECSEALTSFKYFCEEMRELAIVGAGSLLGITLGRSSFPVGKVDFKQLFPMNFEEFLWAADEPMLQSAYQQLINKQKISDAGHLQLLKLLYQYFICGGMPEAVKIFLQYRDNLFEAGKQVRQIQNGIIRSYLGDFAKHSGKINAVHISILFENIPAQLAKNIDESSKRFYFKDVIPGRRGFSALEGPMEWLRNAGLILKTKI